MRLETMVVFDDGEQEAFSRLLPYRATLGTDSKDERPIVGRLLSQVIQSGRDQESEPVSFEALARLERVLFELADYFRPQTEASWWREQGAPGADDAVEGLAAGRVRTVADVDAALRIVRDARVLVAEAEPVTV